MVEGSRGRGGGNQRVLRRRGEEGVMDGGGK